MQGTV